MGLRDLLSYVGLGLRACSVKGFEARVESIRVEGSRVRDFKY